MERSLLPGLIVHLRALLSGTAPASQVKFDIPGDFPGVFQIQIDTLGTDFKLNDQPMTGDLSTASTIRFSVGGETYLGSVAYETSVAPGGFNFIGFQSIADLPFGLYCAGTCHRTFDTNTVRWQTDIPTLLITQTRLGTLLDMHLTTHNVLFQQPGYRYPVARPPGPRRWCSTRTAPSPGWDLSLVAGDVVPLSDNVQLDYNDALIAAIGAGYCDFQIGDAFAGVHYEFDIYGNEPIMTPLPVTGLLFGLSLIDIFEYARRRRKAA